MLRSARLEARSLARLRSPVEGHPEFSFRAAAILGDRLQRHARAIGNDFEQSLHALAPDPIITEPSSLMESRRNHCSTAITTALSIASTPSGHPDAASHK
jgi:hypothetical protein